MIKLTQLKSAFPFLFIDIFFFFLQPNRGVFLRNLGLLDAWRWWNQRLRRKVTDGDGFGSSGLSSSSFLLWRWNQWSRISVAAINPATVGRYFLLPSVWFLRKSSKRKEKWKWGGWSLGWVEGSFFISYIFSATNYMVWFEILCILVSDI